MTAIATPEYDALRETIANGVAYGREHGGIHPTTAALMKIQNKAITSGQRAGERAAANVYKPYEFVFATLDPEFQRELGLRAGEAAKLASARARERYVIKALTA